MVKGICDMRDEDFSRSENQRLSHAEKKNLQRELNECLLAIKTLEKPNVHRLLELVRTTISIVGHVSFLGELVLEKAHQSLKRGIRQSTHPGLDVF